MRSVRPREKMFLLKMEVAERAICLVKAVEVFLTMLFREKDPWRRKILRITLCSILSPSLNIRRNPWVRRQIHQYISKDMTESNAIGTSQARARCRNGNLAGRIDKRTIAK